MTGMSPIEFDTMDFYFKNQKNNIACPVEGQKIIVWFLCNILTMEGCSQKQELSLVQGKSRIFVHKRILCIT